MRARLLLVLAALVQGAALAASPPARAAPPADDGQAAGGSARRGEANEDPDPGRFRLSVVPRLLLSTDEGLGAGVRGTVFRDRFGEKPYKTAVSFQAFLTTRLVQHHFLRVDAVDAFGLPLRVTAEAGSFQTLTFNYCGVEEPVACDEASARAAADRAGLVGEEADRFARRHFLVRFLKPYASSVVRWRLSKGAHRPEVFAGWRGDLILPGDLGDEDLDGAPDLFPYPGSLYAARHPKGEPGFSSVALLGASLDGRDSEPDPSRGSFVELSVRASSPLLGSAFSFSGGNATALVFAPLLPERRLTLASRAVLDVLFGDPPTLELAQVGGSRELLAFGGADAGRGIRQQREMGRMKAFVQHEARARVGSFRLLEQDFVAQLAAFVDAGLVAADPDALARLEGRLRFGMGLGARLVWNETFVMRVDVAASPFEGMTPFLYTKPDHPF